MKNKITLKNLNDKVVKMRKEITELRNLMFEWGQQNLKDIEELKKQKSKGEK